MRFVPVKSEEAQAVFTVHRVRALTVAEPTALVNQVRGMLGEFGIVAGTGIAQAAPTAGRHRRGRARAAGLGAIVLSRARKGHAFGRGTDMKAKNRFKNSVIVGIERNSRKLIFIRFIDENKEVALVGVRQLIDSYKEIFGPGLVMTTKQKVQMLKREVEKHQGDVKLLESRLATLRREYATTDLASVQQGKLDLLSAAVLKHTPEQSYTVADRFEALAAAHPGRPFLVWEGREISYGSANRAMNRCAHFARAQGLGPGDTVAMMLENRPEFLYLWFGLAKIGCVPALINTHIVAS